MGTKVYNNVPKFLKEIGVYKAFKKELNILTLVSLYIFEVTCL